ncbi:MAG: hypothetical protein VXX73_05765, partial [Pseudomonadota bacterium]|nr:hypothetical protein [Pseudomonadota bacterium]
DHETQTWLGSLLYTLHNNEKIPKNDFLALISLIFPGKISANFLALAVLAKNAFVVSSQKNPVMCPENAF